MKRRENNNTTLIKNQQPKTDNVNNNNSNRTLTIDFKLWLNLSKKPYSTSKTRTNFYKNKTTKSVF